MRWYDMNSIPADLLLQIVGLIIGTTITIALPVFLMLSRRRHEENRDRLTAIEKKIDHLDLCLGEVRKEYWAKAREDVTQLQLTTVRTELRADMALMRSEMMGMLDKITQSLAHSVAFKPPPA